MKVIGKANGGYLVTVTENELVKATGFAYSQDDFWGAMHKIGAVRDGTTKARELREGVEIPVSSLFDRLSDLRQKEKEVQKAAQTLRALADLMDGNLPAVVAPAEETKNASE